ncbi:MAG TPA: HlyD family efflux transporter periplasmic adaptor subunit [Candidatus Paceibacterota bacterium]|nr:HlyD family efflux transporter periplasmic adaptor subunit [Candidatus Paceibacterota bacterium]
MEPPKSTDSRPASASATRSRANRGNQRARQWLPYLAGMLLVGTLVFALWPQPVRVETAPAVWGPLRVSVNEEGKTRIRHRYVVSAPVAGHLRRTALKAGAPVEGGVTEIAVIDPLAAALLDPRSRALAEARRDTAAANLEKAREAHSFASSELRRFEALAREHAISPQELESAQWRQASASREESAAESALRVAEAELAVFGTAASGSDQGTNSPLTVLAPATGRVLRVFEENSRAVSTGTPILEIGDPSDLEVVIDVLSRDGAILDSGTRIELEHWGGPEILEARLRLVEPAAFTKVSALGVEEQRVNVIADLITPPALRGHLGDNFHVEARIIVWETNRALKVPSGALFRKQEETWAAFVIENGRAQERRLEVGRSNGIETEIRGGLQEGDRVIVYPGDRVRGGNRVRPMTY